MRAFVNRWGGGGSDHSVNYDHVKEHKSTQKTSAPHFTSNETLILMSRPLEDQVILHRYLGIKRFRETWPKYPNHVQRHMKSDPLSSVPHITSIED